MLWADVDFSGLELCTMAQACLDLVGYSTLGDLLNAGVDVHLEMAAAVLGISYEEAVERKREPEVKAARNVAKPINFGLPGGLGPKGFVRFARKGYGFKFTEKEAKYYIRLWKDKRPEFVDYFKHVAEATDATGTATYKQLRVERVRGEATYTEMANGYFQGLGADGSKAALWAATREMYAVHTSPLYGCRAPLFVHDQVIAEVPEERRRADAAARRLGVVMVEACNQFLPDVPTSAVPALSKHWHKEAEQVLDEEGLIIPWDLARRNRTLCWYPDGKEVVW